MEGKPIQAMGRDPPLVQRQILRSGFRYSGMLFSEWNANASTGIHEFLSMLQSSKGL
jgi:hypothetical protein